MLPVFKPHYHRKDLKLVKQVLKSGWWGSGPKAAEFEEKFSKYIGVKHAVALNSCTAALHLAGKVLNLKPGSEVITSPITFVSTAFFADYNNLKIVFADVEEDTLNIDVNDVKRKITDKTKVLLPVHYGGHACDMDGIMNIAEKKNLIVVEDCAHATGGKYKGKMLGSFGDISCFSFQAVKNLAVGDGGMMLTNNEEWAKKAKVLRWVGINKDTSERTGKDQYSWEYDITDFGYKYQMPDIIAAVGLAQFERIEELNGKRRKITKIYNKELGSIDWVETPVEKGYARSANHNYVIKVDKDRNKLMEYLKQKGISTGVHYKPLFLQTVYKHIKAKCPVASRVWKKIVTLPLYPDMEEKDALYVVEAIRKFKD